MVDQVVDASTATQDTRPSQTADASTSTNQAHESKPTVLRAGEAMLIVALVLIFLLVATVCTHLVIRQRRKRRKEKEGNVVDEEKARDDNGSKSTRPNDRHTWARGDGPTVEMDKSETREMNEDAGIEKDIVITEHEDEKKTDGKKHRRHRSRSEILAELPFSPLCEMGESEPRHELADDEVPERHFEQYDIKHGWLEDRNRYHRSWRYSRSDTLADTSWFDDSDGSVLEMEMELELRRTERERRV